MGKYFILIVCSFLFVFPVMGEAIAKRAYQPMHEFKMIDVNNHYKNLVKTRPLTGDEKQLHGLAIAASELKVEKVISPNSDLASLRGLSIGVAMVKKIQEHPRWDVALDAKKLAIINSHSEIIKTTFGENSYGWAWLLYQRGDKPAAKQMLSELYESEFQNGMKMSSLRFDNSSPVTELKFIQQALEPMSDTKEKENMESKLQKLKSHLSNLPDSRMLT